MLFVKEIEMAWIKLIIITLILSSCGVEQQITSHKVMKDGAKNRVHGVKNVGNWQQIQFKTK